VRTDNSDGVPVSKTRRYLNNAIQILFLPVATFIVLLANVLAIAFLGDAGLVVLGFSMGAVSIVAVAQYLRRREEQAAPPVALQVTVLNLGSKFRIVISHRSSLISAAAAVENLEEAANHLIDVRAKDATLN
jgi:hypothetical protein